MVDYRPELHLSAERTWLNDPNGPFWHEGRWHVYFQTNPGGDVPGDLSWGHASSTDLAHWTLHPVAIPAEGEEEIFSGSVVLDRDNTSGFGTRDHPPLVAIYTSNYRVPRPGRGNQCQSLACSLDGGETWTKYPGNPVLDRGTTDFRDPKVFRYTPAEGSPYWVMVVAEALDNQVLFYRSHDLRSWTHLSTFGPAHARGEAWECPDLFALPIDGRRDDLVWVLVVSLNPGGIAGGSGTQYFTGCFDGTTFVPDRLQPEGLPLEAYDWLDHGRDYYAATSWHNVPGNRRVIAAWLSNWDYAQQTPTHPWRSVLALPRELSAVRVGERVELRQRVPREATHGWTLGPPVPVLFSDHVSEEGGPAGEFQVGRCDVGRITLDWDPGTATESGLEVMGGVRISYADGRLSVDRRAAGDVAFHPGFASRDSVAVPLRDGRLRLEVYLDRCSIEVFADDGAVTISELVFPTRDEPAVTVFAIGGAAEGSVRIDTPPRGPLSPR